MLDRKAIFPEPLPEAAEVIARGRERAKTVQVQDSPFLKHYGVESEAQYKRQAAAEGRIMQHAQIGFRDQYRSRLAYAEIYETLAAKDVRVDRYGICLDWAMGLPRDRRKDVPIGTGLMLDTPEDFAKLAESAPVAPHFGDFVMGFPSALESTEAALLAGSTSIGNLGQYFSFRLPGWDDDVASTVATVSALSLLAAQNREVLVHSNLDDGFGAIYTDLASVLGTVLIERYVIGDLLGAHITHCWGHHFTDPVRRMAFHLALTKGARAPGTMVYGNTVSYRGTEAENHASLASYLLTDIQGQRIAPSGHAVNPVPVTENSRIPDIDEIVAAQLFAARLIELGRGYDAMFTVERSQAIADEVLAGAERFRDNVMAGLAQVGVDVTNPFEMLLALKRIGAKRIEELWGAGASDEAAPRGRRPVVEASFVAEIAALANERRKRIAPSDTEAVRRLDPSLMVATTDVHEHGKFALEHVFKQIGVRLLDGGVSVDPDDLATAAKERGADAILVSSYNGIALDYFRALKTALEERSMKVPVLVGGRLNQVPDGSNTSLPVDVGEDLGREGAIVCREIEEAIPALARALAANGRRKFA